MLLETLSKMIEEEDMQVFRLAVCQNGETEKHTFMHANDCNNIYSISKNFTATAVGMLFDRGILSPDTPVSELYEPLNPELWKRLDPRWRDVRISHLLTQTTGHGGMFLDMDCEDIFSYGTKDFLTKVLEAPLVYDPGTKFAYTDSNFYLLSRVVAAATGETLQSFLDRELFRPLSIQGWAWSTCPEGHAMGGTRLFVTLDHMIRFGQLYLNGGVYDGKRLLSEEFVKTATSVLVQRKEKSYYGYSFWKQGDEPAFHCGGMYGQKIFVDPTHGTVVAWQAYDKKGQTGKLLNYLYEYARKA